MIIVGIDEYKASVGETIRVTVEAVKTPYLASWGELPPSTTWKVIQVPSPKQPQEIREFKMPNEELSFEIKYGFPSPTPAGAHYSRTIEGTGCVDGPTDVNPLPFSQTVTLPYIFHPAQS